MTSQEFGGIIHYIFIGALIGMITLHVLNNNPFKKGLSWLRTILGRIQDSNRRKYGNLVKGIWCKAKMSDVSWVKGMTANGIEYANLTVTFMASMDKFFEIPVSHEFRMLGPEIPGPLFWKLCTLNGSLAEYEADPQGFFSNLIDKNYQVKVRREYLIYPNKRNKEIGTPSIIDIELLE